MDFDDRPIEALAMRPPPLARKISRSDQEFPWVMATWAALSLWPLSTLIRTSNGQSVVDAVVCGLIQSVLGFAAWTAYHLVSRRANGISIMILGLVHMQYAAPDGLLSDEVLRLVALMPICMLVGCMLGLSTRLLSRLKRKPSSEAARASADL